MREQKAEYVFPQDSRLALVQDGDTLTVEAHNVTGTKVTRVFEIRGWEELEVVTGEECW